MFLRWKRDACFCSLRDLETSGDVLVSKTVMVNLDRSISLCMNRPKAFIAIHLPLRIQTPVNS